jgi:sugar-specific transcriptional regulator TrmB
LKLNNKKEVNIMRAFPKNRAKFIERTVFDILKSKAQSRIYSFLIRTEGAKAEDIIRGTRLHPSTVRETLSEMFTHELIFRRKLRNQSIGKNPFVYYPIPPNELIRRYSKEIEEKLNRFVNLISTKKKTKHNRYVKIRINDEGN